MDRDNHNEGICGLVQGRAKVHKCFAIWYFFLFPDYPAYMAFRTTLCAGDFLLRVNASPHRTHLLHHRKNLYHFLCAHHLQEVARFSPSDLKVAAELFSVGLRFDAQERIRLDERQKVANWLFKTVTKKISSSAPPKLAPVTQPREVAQFDFEQKFVVQPDPARDGCRELVLKRGTAIQTAIECLRGSPAFSEAGKLCVQALGGRHVSEAIGEATLRGREDAIIAKFMEVVGHYVLRDKSKKGAARMKIAFVRSCEHNDDGDEGEREDIRTGILH